MDQKRLPSRRKVIEIIKELKSVMFAGYSAQVDGMKANLNEYIAYHCSHAIYELANQIEIAMGYMDEKHTDKETLRADAEGIASRFATTIPRIQEILLTDVQAGFDGDPAAKSKEEIIFSYPGFYAIFVYRIAHLLYCQRVPMIPRIMSEYAHSRTGIDIHPGAQIGAHFFIDHGTGIVVGETTVIGENVKLYQGVTLGALSPRKGHASLPGKRHPTVGSDVTIYSGASILGGETTIGDHAVVGGNAFLTDSVAEDTQVVIRTPEPIYRERKHREK